MRRIWIGLLSAVMAGALFGSVPLAPTEGIALNKPGVLLKRVPEWWFDKAAKKLGAARIRQWGGEGKGIALRFPLEKTVCKVGTSIDLRPWFKNKSCAMNWDNFHRCASEGKNDTDLKLQAKLDREFVAKVICRDESQEDAQPDDGAHLLDQEKRGKTGKPMPCEDPDFLKWTFYWKAPFFMTLDAAINKTPAGFKDLASAKASLHRINALLERVLHGARFPEDFGEGRSEFEVYHESSCPPPTPTQIDEKTLELLRMLQEAGYLRGMNTEDLEAIGRLAGVGKTVFYVPRGCDSVVTIRPPRPSSAHKVAMPGWHATSNNARIRFDQGGCPHLEFLK